VFTHISRSYWMYLYLFQIQNNDYILFIYLGLVGLCKIWFKCEINNKSNQSNIYNMYL